MAESISYSGEPYRYQHFADGTERIIPFSDGHFLFSKRGVKVQSTPAKPLLSLDFLFSDFEFLFSRLKPCPILV